MSKVEIDRELLEKLAYYAEWVEEDLHTPPTERKRAAKVASDAKALLAQPAATTAQGPTRWQDYPWLPMFFTGPSSSARWFCVSPDGCFEEWSKKPKLTDAGWEGIGFGVRVSYVNLNGTDWRATLREILP